MTNTEKNAAAMLSTRDMAFCSLFAVLTGVGAHIRIPLPFIPLTLQTLMVLLAGLLLGARRGAVSMAIYLAMGLLGLPVFTTGGGFQSVLSPSFGFIVGFIPAAWTVGRICEAARPSAQSARRAAIARLSASVAGTIAYDVVGVAWLYFNLNYIAGKNVSLYQTLQAGLLPFVATDMIKLAAAVVIVSIASNRLSRFISTSI
jgi:biotin transport system substrate-specific component